MPDGKTSAARLVPAVFDTVGISLMVIGASVASRLEAAATIGVGQSAACRMSTYFFAIEGGGALSLPIKNPITDG